MYAEGAAGPRTWASDCIQRLSGVKAQEQGPRSGGGGHLPRRGDGWTTCCDPRAQLTLVFGSCDLQKGRAPEKPAPLMMLVRGCSSLPFRYLAAAGWMIPVATRLELELVRKTCPALDS